MLRKSFTFKIIKNYGSIKLIIISLFIIILFCYLKNDIFWWTFITDCRLTLSSDLPPGFLSNIRRKIYT